MIHSLSIITSTRVVYLGGSSTLGSPFEIACPEDSRVVALFGTYGEYKVTASGLCLHALTDIAMGLQLEGRSRPLG